MALTPISLFQSQGNGIAQFLQGGQNALASALNNVIQVGRDTANKQFAQERDFLSEQKRVEDLAQRRGENLQQQSNFDRTFARNLFTTDREFADRNADQARQEERMSANDLFSQTDVDRKFEIQKSEAESLQKSRDMQIQEAERGIEQRKLDEEFFRAAAESPGVLPPNPEETPVRPSDIFRTRPPAMEPPATAATQAPRSPEENLADASFRVEAARRSRDVEGYRKAIQEEAAAKAQLREAGGSVGGVTESERQRNIRFQQSQEDRVSSAAEAQQTKVEKAADQERKQANAEITALVRADPKGFPPAQSFLPAETASDTPEIKQKRAEAALLDQERETVEIRAALNSPDVEDYLGKAFDTEQASGGRWTSMSAEEKRALAVKQLGEAQVANRELLWNKAEKTGLGKRVQPKKKSESKTAPAAPAAAPTAPAATPAPAANPMQQEIDRIKASQERNRQ